MTNKELQNYFESIEDNSDNIFDILLKLKEKKEEYSIMEISKIIPDINDAYEYYFKHKNITRSIVKGILKADYSGLTKELDLDKLFGEVPESYQDTFAELIKDAKGMMKEE